MALSLFPFRVSRAALLCALVLVVPVAGCKSSNFGDVTGSTRAQIPSEPGALNAYIEDWGKKYDASPANKSIALTYGRALRAGERSPQALAVLQTLALKYPNDMEVLGDYGKVLADNGRLKEAQDVLTRAHTPERPNWRILSAQGSVADQLGQQEQAQGYYAAALKIVPDEPSVLSNLGLSYALSKNLPMAEQVLKQAEAQPRADQRVRQNLALVLALEGKFKEAEQVSAKDLSPQDAANNVLAIRNMIAQSSTWKDIQLGGKPKVPGKKA